MYNCLLMQHYVVHYHFTAVARVPPSGKSISIRNKTDLWGPDDTVAAKTLYPVYIENVPESLNVSAAHKKE